MADANSARALNPAPPLYSRPRYTRAPPHRLFLAKRVKHLFLPTIVLSACGLLTPAGATQGGKPNILLLVADDLGVDAVGAYGEGGSPPPTPNIDALAASGVLFRNAWAYASCTPTRACLHTGRHAFRTFVGAVINGGTMRLEEYTMPEVLDREGTGYAHAREHEREHTSHGDRVL